MSTDFRTIRQPSSDPLLKYVTSMSKLLSKQTVSGLIDQLESSEDIYSDGRDVESGVKFQTDLNHNHVFDFTKNYYAMGESSEVLEAWYRGYNMGFYLRDFSEHNRPAELHGEPILVDGAPFDYGLYDGSVGVKSTALRFNRPTTNDKESIQVPDNSGIQISGGTGFSQFIRFRLFDLDDEGGDQRTLFQKIDDTNKDDAYMAQITDEGRLKWYVKRAGNIYKSQTPADTIDTDVVYGCFVTYANSGNVQHIYTWNDEVQTPTVTDNTLTSPSDPSFQSDDTVFDLFIFEKGKGSEGYVYGDFFDYKMYDDYVVSSTEVQRLANNKLTISNIPFGQVMMTNHWATGVSLSSTSYTSTSYTSTSYTR